MPACPPRFVNPNVYSAKTKNFLPAVKPIGENWKVGSTDVSPLYDAKFTPKPTEL